MIMNEVLGENMVIAPIAAAAAPAVVSSATNDEGLINRLFKIAILIGVLVLAVISIVILSWVLEISNLVGAAGGAISTTFNIALRAIPGGNLLLLAGTFIGSAFGFGRR